MERLVPYIESCGEEVVLNIVFAAPKPVVFGHWLNISRTLVNLASNSIDAMADNTGPKQLYSFPVARGREEIRLKLTTTAAAFLKNL